MLSVKDFGAKGDGIADDTAAIQAAIDSGADRVFLPLGKYRVTAPIQLRTGLLVEGQKPFQSGRDGVKIVAEGQASVFLAGATSRLFFDVRNLWIVGTGVEVGLNGQFGGRLDHVHFENLATGVNNPMGYWTQHVRCRFTDCGLGIFLDVANNAILDTPFFNRCKVGAHIKNGFSVGLLGVGANVNHAQTDTVLRLDATSFDLVNSYFEAWPTAGYPLSATFVDVVLNKFAAPNFAIRNCDFDAKNSMSHLIRMGLQPDQVAVTGIVDGEICHNRLGNPQISPFVYGEGNGFSGVKYYGNTIGGSVTTLDTNKHPKLGAFRPIASVSIPGGASIAGATFLEIPLSSGSAIFANTDGFSTNPNRFRVYRAGLYRVTANVIVSSAATAYRNVEIVLRRNGITQTTAVASLLNDGAGAAYQTVSVSAVLDCAYGSDIHLYGRNGETVHGGTFVAEYLGDGNY